MTTLENTTVRKVMWRLLPVSMLMFFFSLLDRTNISFAALDMNRDLMLSPSQYGTAAGIFFIGYLAFEIPSNFMLERFGARLWLTRIMVTWGLVVAAMVFVQGATSLYVLRFLLGVAEAGLLPGLLLYLGQWLPARQRGKAYATLLMTTAIAYAVGAPLTTTMMQISLGDLKGWQAMFLIQGLVTVVFGALCYFLLPNRIADSSWLDDTQKRALAATLAQEEQEKRTEGATSMMAGFFDPRVLMAAATCFFLVCCNFGTVLWLPQIVKGIFPTLTNIQISLLISLAFFISGLGGIWTGRNSDRSGDRKWHLVVCALLATVGFAYAGWATDPILRFIGICVAILGIWSMFGVFWAYTGDLLGGEAAVGGFAFVNSVGSLGGVVAPLALAYGLEKTGNVGGALYVLALFALVTAALCLCLRRVTLTRAQVVAA
ncbi:MULTISPECIES: MFS transporter [unclassified Beijerinckia]|uniref:MFS transporter n=1 Tax=unclassified Beijerinckia TaxID=2638183 RepID=UPI00089A7BB2|nr:MULTISPECIES: MFS transporter [unclassified Beijerinckia]MDH7795188.1 ACS family tartrate transporter-like MFS transporter [Beijerinckia sp. GAS462]SEB91176.1 MFS transporter, ACS family, tartrate transporter [Beijerinckia sp. 28-YEA-48]